MLTCREAATRLLHLRDGRGYTRAPIESNGADQLTHVIVWVNVDESSSDRSPHFLVENLAEGREGVTKSTKSALCKRTGKA